MAELDCYNYPHAEVFLLVNIQKKLWTKIKAKNKAPFGWRAVAMAGRRFAVSRHGVKYSCDDLRCFPNMTKEWLEEAKAMLLMIEAK